MQRCFLKKVSGEKKGFNVVPGGVECDYVTNTCKGRARESYPDTPCISMINRLEKQRRYQGLIAKGSNFAYLGLASLMHELPLALKEL